MNVKEILIDLGYSNISEGPKEYRMRPIYRDSDNNTNIGQITFATYYDDLDISITSSNF